MVIFPFAFVVIGWGVSVISPLHASVSGAHTYWPILQYS